MRRRILKSVFLGKKPAHLILHVTNRCNLRCKTCFVDFSDIDNNELTLKEIEGIAKYLNGLVWLDIGGGEPFLRKDLPDICAAFDAGSISISTNGLNPPLIRETVERTRGKTAAEVNITVSIDGFEETNDDIRAMGSFKKSVETLKLLKDVKGIRIKINTVLCDKNYSEILDFMKFIKGFGPDFHSIIFRRGVESAPPPFDRPSYEKLLKIKNDIFRIWNTYDYGFKTIEGKILKNYQRLMYETSLKIIKEGRQIPDCMAGKRHLVIYANGDFAFCEMLKPFGNIRNADIEAVLRAKDAEAQRNFIREKRCFCHHNCNMIDNFFLNPLRYPNLLNGIWK